MTIDHFDIALAESTTADVELWRTRAVESVTDLIYDRLSDDLAPFGERGRSYCREDLNYHLDYLTGSLIAGNAQPFRDYVVWLRDLLRARNVPIESLDLSLELLADFFRERLPPDRFQPVGQILDEARAGLGVHGDKTVAPPRRLAGTERPHPSTEALADALVNGDRARARKLTEESTAEGGYLQGAVGLIQPAMYRIGERWQIREISVAQEHLATALAQRILAAGFTATSPAPPSGERALFACVETNHHAVGLQMVADAFELEGWSVDFLGADTPTSALVERIEQTQPDLVGLSVSMTRQLPRLREAAVAIRSRFGQRTPQLVAGGLGLAGVTGVAERLGLDGWYPTARAAIEVSR